MTWIECFDGDVIVGSIWRLRSPFVFLFQHFRKMIRYLDLDVTKAPVVDSETISPKIPCGVGMSETSVVSTQC